MREMKDSGIPWLKEIPESWSVERGKNVLTLCKRPVREDDDVVTCFRDGEVVLRSERRTDGFTMSDKEIGYQGIDEGDIVIHGMDGFAGAMGVSRSTGKGSPVLIVCNPKYDAYPQYLIYYLRSLAMTDVFLALATGVRERSCDLRWNKISELEFIIPSASEQKLIADYLDRKCGEIDELVVLQEKMIEELKSYKQSVITEAVTKGLNPNAPMKDSGIEWIGEIPEGWEISRIKNHSRFVNGFAFDSNIFKLEEAVPVIRIGDIATTIDYDGCVKVPFSPSLEQYTIKNNDILIAMSGATTGKCCFVNDAKAAYINQRVGIVRSEISKYLYYSLQAAYFYEYVSLNSAGSAQPNISSGGIGEFMIAIPQNTAEFNTISSYLDEKCGEIDSLIALKQQKIEHLKEYKKSLIYEYVTGKKQVASADGNALPSA